MVCTVSLICSVAGSIAPKLVLIVPPSGLAISSKTVLLLASSLVPALVLLLWFPESRLAVLRFTAGVKVYLLAVVIGFLLPLASYIGARHSYSPWGSKTGVDWIRVFFINLLLSPLWEEIIWRCYFYPKASSMLKPPLAVSVLYILLLLTIPAELFAKADTSKIIIKGADLGTPIEITDAKTLANFAVWTGPGTSCSGCPKPGTESFIVNWSQPVAAPAKGLQRYEVSFYAKMPNERLVYVVFYEYDPATAHGYIYLPGRADESYSLNMGTIARGVEGKWFRAWAAWEGVARPLIAGARTDPKLPSCRRIGISTRGAPCGLMHRLQVPASCAASEPRLASSRPQWFPLKKRKSQLRS